MADRSFVDSKHVTKAISDIYIIVLYPVPGKAAIVLRCLSEARSYSLDKSWCVAQIFDNSIASVNSLFFNVSSRTAASLLSYDVFLNFRT